MDPHFGRDFVGDSFGKMVVGGSGRAGFIDNVATAAIMVFVAKYYCLISVFIVFYYVLLMLFLKFGALNQAFPFGAEPDQGLGLTCVPTLFRHLDVTLYQDMSVSF
ncbi:hypothetical protein ABAC402_10235 [Asticcacaulis sp. AC402]|nr:hypothetical protein ABAC402_10235 [Asticcacaulis sp. AC402]